MPDRADDRLRKIRQSGRRLRHRGLADDADHLGAAVSRCARSGVGASGGQARLPASLWSSNRLAAWQAWGWPVVASDNESANPPTPSDGPSILAADVLGSSKPGSPGARVPTAERSTRAPEFRAAVRACASNAGGPHPSLGHNRGSRPAIRAIVPRQELKLVADVSRPGGPAGSG
jgi:hypothetical protein